MLSTGCTKKAKEARYSKEGEQFYKSGEYDKAKIDYLKVLRLNPQNAVAFARLGAIWLDEGAPLRAGAFLKRAEELAPKDNENRLRLARVYLSVGQPAEAQKEVLAVLQQEPTNGKALVLLTEMARTPADIGRADAALQKFPDKGNVSYHLASANVALRKRDLAGAQQAIRDAVAADPKSPEAHQAMAVVDLLQKNPKAAGEEFKTAADLAPARSNIQITYAEYLAQTKGKDAVTDFLKGLTKKAPDFLPAWILRGRIAFSDKKFDQALSDLENVFSRDPENIDARLLQTDIFLAKKQTDKAITELDKLDKAYPNLPPVKFRIAQADLQQNRAAEAGAALDQAIDANPNYTEAILLRAELNLRTGHVPPALDALEDLRKKHPELKPAQLLLADAYRASGRLDDAAAIFNEQIKATPKTPDPYFFLGLVQQQQKKNDEARKSYEKALELSPDNLLAISQLIDLDLEAKDYAAATGRVDEQIKKHPKAAAPYLLQGKVQMAQGHWKETEAAARKALELDSNSGAAYDMLVRSYLATNKLSEAARELESVLTKAPQNQSALMTLATIREQQKDYAKARDAYEKLLVIDP
ncbi:MAG TPA: tetratricopeptide repeat protein, partial [Chthoniobacterales bacterium]